MENIDLAYKWTLNLGIALAVIISICSYGHIPAPIPYLGDVVRVVLVGSGIGYSIALLTVYSKLPTGTISEEFSNLAFKVFGLFVFYVILDVMSQKIISGEFN